MGNVNDHHVDITKDQLDPAHFNASFEKAELEKLFVNFKKLDANGDGFLQKDEFMQVEALTQNPLVPRVLEVFDDDGNDKIDFTEFVCALEIFCSTDGTQNQAKIDFAFQIYDVNNDGFISNGDLFRILKIMVGENLDDTQLQQLVDRTIFLADKDKDGKLSKEEFVEFIQGSDIESKLVVDLNAQLQY